MTITGTNFAAGATVTFGRDSGDECGGGEQHDDHGNDAGACSRGGDGDGDQPGGRAAAWPAGSPTLRHADGEQCESEQRSTAGGTAVTITGTNFAAGATVTFGRVRRPRMWWW